MGDLSGGMCVCVCVWYGASGEAFKEIGLGTKARTFIYARMFAVCVRV